jgi:hypothetical protein
VGARHRLGWVLPDVSDPSRVLAPVTIAGYFSPGLEGRRSCQPATIDNESGARNERGLV